MKNSSRKFYDEMKNLSIEEILFRSSNYNGYEREAAVVRLSEINETRFIPILLIRANDWVKDISVIAKKAILDLLIPENIHDIIQYIPQIFHLEKCQRHSHNNFLVKVKEYLQQPEFRQHLLTTIASKNIKQATLAFELFSESNHLSLKDNILLGLKSKGIIIAKQSLNLTNQLSDADFLEIKDSFIQHRASYVATRALKRIVKINPSLIDDQLTHLLFHKSSDIRLIAQNRCLEKDIQADQVYLTIISSEKETISKKSIAIQGISEVQQQECLPLIRDFLRTTKNNHIYKTSIDIIIRLLKDDAKPEITSGLLSKSLPPETLNSISTLCKKYYISYSWSELLEISYSHNNDIDFLFKMSLIGSKWNSLIYYLKLIDEQRADSEMITPMLFHWGYRFNKQHLNPTQNEKLEIGKLFNSVLANLSHGLQNHIRFLTKSFL